MRIVGELIIEDCITRHPASEAMMLEWLKRVRAAVWRSPLDLRKDFPKVDTLKNSRAVFDLAWNRYRIVAEVVYQRGLVVIRFAGSHSEYDRISADNV